jgi:hypothetical protein
LPNENNNGADDGARSPILPSPKIHIPHTPVDSREQSAFKRRPIIFKCSTCLNHEEILLALTAGFVPLARTYGSRHHKKQQPSTITTSDCFVLVPSHNFTYFCW